MSFKVNNQLPPDRCTICHQADLFDPQKEYCQRCADLAIPPPIPAPAPLNEPYSQSFINRLVASSLIIATTATGIIAGGATAYMLVDVSASIVNLFLKDSFLVIITVHLANISAFIGIVFGALLGSKFGIRLSKGYITSRQNP